MERGERERWNKLSQDAKMILRAMAQYADIGRVHLNDLRMKVDLRALGSRDVLALWDELQSRDYGNIHDADGADPVFVLNVPTVQTLAQSHRLTDQAPHRPRDKRV